MSSAFPLSSPIEVEGTGGAPGQIDISDGTNAVQLRAPTGLTSNIDFTLPTTVGTTGQFLQRSGATSTAWATGSGSNNESTLPISLRFNDSNGSPVSVNSNTFQVLSRIIYQGTTLDNTINRIIAIVETSNSAATGQLQLFDITNSLIIATSAVFGPAVSGLLPTIIDLGTISNLPAASAIFEVQLRRVNVGGGGAAELDAFQILG
jgi:hypothetical protein